MKIAVLGTGTVGQTIGTRLVGLGHEVTMGSRQAGNEKAVGWAAATGDGAAEGSFADAAGAAELAFNCTAGTGSLSALEAAGAERLAGKVLVDVANPLDFSKGMPPTLSVCNEDSLGEQIQRAFTEARVVKALNMVNASVMTEPAALSGEHDTFVAGNDDEAKAQVRGLLESFGWRTIHDLGDITAARGMEMYLPLWLRLMGATGGPGFNIRVVN